MMNHYVSAREKAELWIMRQRRYAEMTNGQRMLAVLRHNTIDALGTYQWLPVL